MHTNCGSFSGCESSISLQLPNLVENLAAVLCANYCNYLVNVLTAMRGHILSCAYTDFTVAHKIRALTSLIKPAPVKNDIHETKTRCPDPPSVDFVETDSVRSLKVSVSAKRSSFRAWK